MMAQSRAESTRDTYNYGQYLNQFLPNTIKVIREFERIQKKICRHKMSIMFNIYICVYMKICSKSPKSHSDFRFVTQLSPFYEADLRNKDKFDFFFYFY